VDVAIYYEVDDYSGLHSITLLNEKLTPLCSPALLEGDKPLRKPEDLKHHNLLHDFSTGDWKRWLKKAGVKGINLNHGSIFSHSSMVQQAAIFGQGVAMGHIVLSQPEVQAGRLVRPFEMVMESSYSYDIVCPTESADRPKVKAFIDWLVETVKTENT